MKALVLAAGKGVRLWPLTETTPKPLLPIAGRPLLHRTIEGLASSGIEEIILVVNYKASEIKKAIQADGDCLDVEIRYLKQNSTEGTANAVQAAEEILQDNFLVVYADNYYAPEAIKRFLKSAGRTRLDTILVGTTRVEDASQFGRLTVRDGRVISIREKSPDKEPGDVIAGLYLMNESIFSAIKRTKRSRRGEYELTDSLQYLIDGKSVKVQPVTIRKGEWQSISYPWDLLEANRLTLDSMKAASNGVIEPGVKVAGKLVSSKSSLVRSGCYIEGPAYIGEDATVGPNTYIRPYTVIGRRAHVGANCEIKNSVLMEDAKVPHLSYVGDSILGANVSLGAGTITANLRFDNAPIRSFVKDKLVDSRRRKLGVVMGDGVKTGINVSILPGVKIGSGAWLGPGLVIGSDVPTGAHVKRSDTGP